MSATPTMLVGIFFALFGALDERAQKDAQEILSRICNNPKASLEEARLFRLLAESIEGQYDDKMSPRLNDFIDRLIAGLLRTAEPASENQTRSNAEPATAH
jgi:hypothetical protein